MAPFTAHTIDKNAITSCDDCHNSAALVEYDNTGQIKVVTWDAGTSSLTHIEGIVPVPFDFQTSMIFDFVDLDEERVKTGQRPGKDRAKIGRVLGKQVI